MKVKKTICALAGAAACMLPTLASAAEKPNILIIWGDDIGGFNISAYNQGMKIGRAHV